MRILLAIGMMILGGCVSPYAWKDLGDGEGMRGWAGIPLKDSMAYAAAHQPVNVYMRENYVPPVYVPPMVQTPIVSSPGTPYVPIPQTTMPSIR